MGGANTGPGPRADAAVNEAVEASMAEDSLKLSPQTSM